MIKKETTMINDREIHLFFDTDRQAYLVTSDAMNAFLECIQELKKYIDAEEKGLLLRLPCNAGDPVYRINPGAMDPIIEMMVQTIAIRHHATSGKSVCLFCNDLKDLNESYYLEKAFGNDVFFTIEEAKAALKKMQEEKQ